MAWIVGALIAVAVFEGLLIIWLTRRTDQHEVYLSAIRKRFDEAGIDLSVTKPLQTDVRLPEVWQEGYSTGVTRDRREVWYDDTIAQ